MEGTQQAIHPQSTVQSEIKANMLIFGETNSGKTALVNSIKVKPMRLSGAESVAGICLYTERMPISVKNDDEFI